MSLNASLNRFKADISEAASRNAAHSRPAGPPARTSTPKLEAAKRTHEAAFTGPPAQAPAPNQSGSEVFTQVWTVVRYLKDKELRPVPFDQLIGYLSLPNDAAKNIPVIKRLLMQDKRVTHLSKAESGLGKEAFKYKPLYPVTNAEELKDYLARQQTAQGIQVKDLKDGWPDCASHLDKLEREGSILVTRNKKDNTPRMVWTDSPTYHILNAAQQPQKADADFVDVWAKTKLPGSEMELRNELEKAGLTPTSQVKEVRTMEAKRKEKRRINRKGGKTTNSHMLGILKDYSKR